MAAAKQPGIGRLVDDSMAAVERDNRMLKDVLPKDYARQSLDQTRLGQLIEANLRSLGFPPPEDGPTGMIDYGKFRLSPERLREQYANYRQLDPLLPEVTRGAVAESVVHRFETCYDWICPGKVNIFVAYGARAPRELRRRGSRPGAPRPPELPRLPNVSKLDRRSPQHA